MFVMNDNPEFENKVEGTMPGDEGEPFSFRARFAALSTTEQDSFDLGTGAGTVAFLQRTFVGFSDVLDAHGAPVSFSEEARDWLIDRVYARGALVKSYFGGVYEAARGN